MFPFDAGEIDGLPGGLWVWLMAVTFHFTKFPLVILWMAFL